MIYSRTDSGLVLAEHGADEATVARALREYDPDLRLIRGVHPDTQTWFWKVYRYAGSERPAEFICAWEEKDGTPLPLSSRLLDKVRELDRNTRVAALDADVANAQLRERQAKAAEDFAQDLIDDHRKRATHNRAPMFHKTPGYIATRKYNRDRWWNR